MEEIWKNVNGFEGIYEVNNVGIVRTVKSGFLRKLQLAPNGYYSVTLKLNGKSYRKDVHRIVALAFLPQIEGKNWVNHIDNNKLNNNIDNLEWCTPKENMLHCMKNGRFRPENGLKKAIENNKKTVYQYSKDGELINIFNSMNDAVRETNTQQSQISRCCNNKSKTANGYIWRFSPHA